MATDPRVVFERQRELRNKNTELEYRVSAASHIHSAAVMAGNGKLADEQRQLIHTLTDMILDNTASIITLAKGV